MTVDKALEIIDRTIAQTLEIYNESSDSKDQNGVRIPHPLDYVDDSDKLFALDIALKDVALKTIPMSLLEANGSTASELKRVSKDYYVRVPAYPQAGQALDIDDGLAYAVVFYALENIWSSGFSKYQQKGDMICNIYNNAYRKVIDEILSGNTTASNVSYIRFSADGVNWHDSYQDGDIYISFKKIDTDTWTPAIKFVGDDGQPCSDTQFVALKDTPASYTGFGGKIVAVKATEDGVEFIDAPTGGGASNFTDLQDTPADYTNAAGKKVKVNTTANALEFVDDSFVSQSDTPASYTGFGGKIVAVKATEDGLEFIDPPASSAGTVAQFGDSVFYDDAAVTSIELDAQTYNSFYLYPNGNLTITFKKFDDGTNANASALFGSIYTFVIVNAGFDIAFDSNEVFYGDASILKDINYNYPLTLIRAYYDGFKWIVIDRVTIPDYQP